MFATWFNMNISSNGLVQTRPLLAQVRQEQSLVDDARTNFPAFISKSQV